MSSGVAIVQMLLVVAGSQLGEGFFPRDHDRVQSPPPVVDCGEPLVLTPFIHAGQIEKAQALAKVPEDRFLGVRSYAAFLTVSALHKSAEFFWYFPAESGPAAPVVLWLQGGPGVSSLFGLFSENGPLQWKGSELRRREVSWSRTHHVLYIDNPVGTGFSYTSDGYAQNETAVGNDLYEALIQFFTLFPDLQRNEFYVTGESYAGKYVPAVCRTIHERNADAKLKINLQGFAIGNGLSDPLNQLQYGGYLYQLGLIDSNGLKQFMETENAAKAYIKAENWKMANKAFSYFMLLLYKLAGYTNYYNYLVPDAQSDMYGFANMFDCDFRSGVHVGNSTFHDRSEVALHLESDMMQSVAPWVAELLQHYRGVLYSGQLDIIVAYPLTENYLSQLNFNAAAEFRTARRKQWRVNGELAGYAKTAGNLTEVLVRNAGHMVPQDQPLWALDLLTRLTANKPFF